MNDIPGDFHAFPDARGHFGRHGGRFVAETLAGPLQELAAAYDAALSAPRKRTWAGLLAQWLSRPADVCHLLAGRTPAGERIHPLGGPPKKRISSGFPVGRSEILLLRRLTLTALLAAGGPGTAVDASAGCSSRFWSPPTSSPNIGPSPA